MLCRVKELKGDAIVACDGEAGSVDDVFFEDRSWGVRYVAVHTGGWLIGRRVLLSPAAIDGEQASGKALRVRMTRAEIERSPRDDADPHLCSSARLIGYDLETPDGAIGHVDDFLVDDLSWSIADMVVDTRNWLPGGKRVLVPPSAVERIDRPARKVRVRLSRDEVRNSPEARTL